MLSRSLKYAILFHLTAFAGLIPVWSSAQETLQRKAPARRSADHATVGDESNSADPSGSHLKQRAIWPGMTRRARSFCPMAGASSRLGDRPSSATCRCRSLFIPANRSWRSFMPGSANMRL